MADAQPRHGRALALVVLLLLVVVVISIARSFWPTNSPSIETTDPTGPDFRNLRFWSPNEVRDRLSANEPIVFLDTRLRTEFDREHIIDSVLFPREGGNDFIPESGKIYVVIVSSDDSSSSFWQSLVDFFQERNMNYAFLQDGVEGWRAIGGSVVSAGDPNSLVDQSKVTFVTADQARAYLDVASGVTFIDVRPAIDFSRGHIPGAINIPLSELERRRGELPAGRSFVVYANDSKTAFQGGVRLFDMNFFGPRVLNEGFPHWQEIAFPVEK